MSGSQRPAPGRGGCLGLGDRRVLDAGRVLLLGGGSRALRLLWILLDPSRPAAHERVPPVGTRRMADRASHTAI